MIVVQLMGGLGNQLFQYAAGRQVALHHQTELFLDTRWFKTQTLRRYRLNEYPIRAKVATKWELLPFAQTLPGSILRGIRQVIWRGVEESAYRNVTELASGHDAELLNQPGHVYMQGYFQSERYFSGIAGEIRETFNPIAEPDAQNCEILDLIEQTQSVSLHIRRGDYVENPIIQSIHGFCGVEYYYRAIELMCEKVASPHFFIFSDDPDWVESNLDIPFSKLIVRHNGNWQDTEDLRLMSHCKYHIIANSSFSWWGAWLAKKQHKIIVAPSRWFSDDKLDMKFLLPENWVRL